MLLGVWLSLPIWAPLPSVLFRKVSRRSWGGSSAVPMGQECWQYLRKGCHPGIGEGVRKLRDRKRRGSVWLQWKIEGTLEPEIEALSFPRQQHAAGGGTRPPDTL